MRVEKEHDRDAVYAVNLSAFETQAEADLVDALREQARPVVSLVAEEMRQVIGHIMFSPVSLSGQARLRMMGLALAAVLICGSPVFAQSPADGFASRLADAAMERLAHEINYEGSYRRIGYPNGDVPGHIGVCTDLVVRAYRTVGIDLQKAVHEDMTANFAAYPTLWGLSAPDANIDHRRVPNLQVFFKRKGMALTKSPAGDDYRPGDLVTWMLPGNLPHIGIVVADRSSDGRRPLIVHNIGAGPAQEDVLFEFPITGHYRYGGSS